MKRLKLSNRAIPMNVFYGAQATDDCNTSWNAIKVYRDGNPIHLGGPFASQEEAEEFADNARKRTET